MKSYLNFIFIFIILWVVIDKQLISNWSGRGHSYIYVLQNEENGERMVITYSKQHYIIVGDRVSFDSKKIAMTRK